MFWFKRNRQVEPKARKARRKEIGRGFESIEDRLIPGLASSPLGIAIAPLSLSQWGGTPSVSGGEVSLEGVFSRANGLIGSSGEDGIRSSQFGRATSVSVAELGLASSPLSLSQWGGTPA